MLSTISSNNNLDTKVRRLKLLTRVALLKKISNSSQLLQLELNVDSEVALEVDSEVEEVVDVMEVDGESTGRVNNRPTLINNLPG
jgi:hypothetical protein